jgi:serine/threonine protein kinase
LNTFENRRLVLNAEYHALGGGTPGDHDWHSDAYVTARLPTLGLSNHLFCWGFAAALAISIVVGSDDVYFAVYAAVNFGVFLWTCGVFAVSRTLVANLQKRVGTRAPPAILETQQLLTRFLLAYVVCNTPWTVVCVYLNIYGQTNEVLFGIADPLLVWQGFANYLCYTARRDHFIGCYHAQWWEWCCIFQEDNDLESSSKLEGSDMSRSDGNRATFLNVLKKSQRGQNGDGDGPVFKAHLHKLQCEIDPQRITVGEIIGIGSSATVRRGVFGNANVAIKIPRVGQQQTLESSISSGSFPSEVAVLVTALSPCVVQFFGVCRLPEGICIITELCETSLAKHIKKVKSKSPLAPSPPSWAEDHGPAMMQWMTEIASGLTCLHSKGVLHGDLKPANVLLHHGTAKLCDFGCARLISANSSSATGLGTMGYMCYEMMQPELAAGAMSAKVDVFAFGSTCWSMVELREPFEGEEEPSIFWVKDFVQKGGRLPIGNEECPPALKAMIHSCWETSAADRPTTSSISRQLRAITGSTDLHVKVTAGRPVASSVSSISATISTASDTDTSSSSGTSTATKKNRAQ